jgi:hypothetical protein
VLEYARQFLGTVLPEPGEGRYLNIHWSGLAPEGHKYWDGRACTSVDEAIKTISWAMKLGGKDIYTCMSLQAKMNLKTSAKGNQYKKAERLADDVVAIQSLFIDVDVKDEAYKTTAEALAAFKEFVTSSGMPLPTACVGSGSGGFHAHWVLDTPLKRDEWQQLANALQHATQSLGLKTDSQCTIDSARILRVPETLNFKHDPAKPTTLMSLGAKVSLSAVREALAPHMGKTHVKPAGSIFENGAGPSYHAGPANDNSELGVNLTPGTADKAKLEDVARSCAFIGRSLGTGGADNNQPLWFITGALSTHLEDGLESFHLLSNQHPSYKQDETDALYNRLANTAKKRDMGWPQCSKIAAFGTKECQTCPLLVQGKSPLNFAQPPKVAVVLDSLLPDRYVRSADGIISLRSVNEDGSQLLIPLCHYPIMNGWLSNNPWTFHFTTKTELGRKSVMEIPTEVIFTKEGIGKYLGAKGFFCTDKQYKILKEFS